MKPDIISNWTRERVYILYSHLLIASWYSLPRKINICKFKKKYLLNYEDFYDGPFFYKISL